MAKENPDSVIGLISQQRLDPHLLQLTPGVHLKKIGDTLGQRYVSPEEAVLCRGADIVIVGRGITEAANPAEEAELYRAEAFAAFLKRNGSLN